MAWIAAGMAACAGPQRPVRVAEPAPASVRHAPVAAPIEQPPAKPVDPRRSQELFVRCEDRASCPAGVGMLVVESDGQVEPERCTASLIAPDRALTASHCLAPTDRHAGASCPSTWLSFPATEDAPAEWVACERIVYAAEVVGEDALHQEHAVLQLAHPVARAPFTIDPLPPAQGSIVMVVSVTPHPVYGSTHALSTRLCRAVDSTAPEAALGPDAGRVGWLSNCPIAHGNSGSPVIDRDGRIRAVVHGGTAVTSAYAVTSALSQ